LFEFIYSLLALSEQKQQREQQEQKQTQNEHQKVKDKDKGKGKEEEDDLRSINSESTISPTDEFGDETYIMPELTRLSDKNIPAFGTTPLEEQPTASESTSRVKQRPPKENKKDLQIMKKLEELCKNSDPLLVYSNMVKVGQG
jgi:hypothetical protein